MQVLLTIKCTFTGGRGSIVSIVMQYGTDGLSVKPAKGEIYWTHPHQPHAHPVSCTVATGSLLRVKQPGMALTTRPLLAPRSSTGRVTRLPPFCCCLASNRTAFYIY